MKRLEAVLSVITIFTISIFIVTFADTLLFRSADIYSYHFNDTRVLEEIHTTFTANEMAEEIAGYFNSKTDDIFRVQENTGYDMEDIFTKDEGKNIQKIKRFLDIEGIACMACFIITFGIYFHLIRDDKKRLLASSYKLSIPLSLASIGIRTWYLISGRSAVIGMKLLGLIELGEESALNTILGRDFIIMSGKFFAVVAILIFIAVTYVALRVTRQQRLFFRG